MALVQFGSLVTGIRGKSGGSLFSTNNGTAFVSNQSRKIKSFKSQNQQQKSRYNQVQSLWKSLTAEQRETWQIGAASETYIDKIGNKRHYTPRSLFFERNLNLITVNDITILSYFHDIFPISKLTVNNFQISTLSQTVSYPFAVTPNQSIRWRSVFLIKVAGVNTRFTNSPVNGDVKSSDYNINPSATYSLISNHVNLYPNLILSLNIFEINKYSGISRHRYSGYINVV